jgi:VanZ family protein
MDNGPRSKLIRLAAETAMSPLAHAAVWLAAVLVLSLTPGAYLPPPPFSWMSAAAHVVMYGVLAMLLVRAIRWPNPLCCAIVTFASATLGALMELAQVFIPGRYGDPWDALLNLLGAAAGSYIYLAAKRLAARLASARAAG